jgi:hypothetical protein
MKMELKRYINEKVLIGLRKIPRWKIVLWEFKHVHFLNFSLPENLKYFFDE